MKPLFRSITDAAAEADSSGQPQPQALKELRSSGVLGLSIPYEFGGKGVNARECNQSIAELSSYDASLGIIAFQHQAVARRIVEHGTEEQKQRFLPQMASGELLAASAWSEKGAGANKQRLSTTAIVQADGSWLLNGTKTFTTGAGMAGVYLVLVRTGEEDASAARYGAGGQTFFLVESERIGVITRTDLDLTGMRSSSTGFLELVNCSVPAANILAPIGRAAEVIADVRRCGLTLGAVSLGIADAALEIACQAVLKQPIDSRQRLVSSVRLSRMAVQRCAARALVDRAGGCEPDTVGMDTLAAKIFASEVSEQICRETQQILGGSGFLRGTKIDRLCRDSRAIALMGPVNDLALELMLEELLG